MLLYTGRLHNAKKHGKCALISTGTCVRCVVYRDLRVISTLRYVRALRGVQRFESNQYQLPVVVRAGSA
jgi:hypothetical protein